MAAFGYEECGDYARADACGTRSGRAAIRATPGRCTRSRMSTKCAAMSKRGMPWLRDSAHGWAPENGFAYHNWWHLALLHLDRGDDGAGVAALRHESAARCRIRGDARMDRCVRAVVAAEARRCRYWRSRSAIAGRELGAHRGRRLLRLQRPARDHGVSRRGAFARCRAHACGDAAGRLQRRRTTRT